MNKFDTPKAKRTTFEVAALFVFALVVISNLAIIRFTEGYFAFYDIPMADVNYTPQMYDYLRIALPVIITAIIVTTLMTAAMWLAVKAGDKMASITRPNNKTVKFVKRHRRFFGSLSSTLGLIIKIGIVGVSFWAFWIGLYSISADVGKSYAANRAEMTSISTSGEVLQKVIIHKGNEELILKTYDTSNKEFKPGYEILYNADYNARVIDL